MATRTDLELVKKKFKAARGSTYGELTFTKKPDLDGYFTSNDAPVWRKLFSHFEWVAQEADGGVIGYFTAEPGQEAVVVYLDNEGSFHITGNRFVDQLGFAARGDDMELRAFCREEGIPPPMSEAQRKKLSKQTIGPDTVLEKLRGGANEKPRRAAKDDSRAARGPRPFTRTVALCTLSDGQLFAVTGSDFGQSYGEDQKIVEGATFTFAPHSSAFTAHPPIGNRELGAPALAFATADGALVITKPADGQTMVSLSWERSSGRWSKPTLTPVKLFNDVSASSVFGRALDAHTVLVLGGGDKAAIYRANAWSQLADLPEGRLDDRVIPYGAGRVLVGGGKTIELGSYHGDESDKTWILDIAKNRWLDGPALPTTGGKLVARPNGGAVLIEAPQIWVLDEDGVHEPFEIRKLGELYSLHTFIATDKMISVRFTDRSVLETNLATRSAKIVGHLLLAKASATAALGDDRVLFLGGTLFANNEAEPEIWNGIDHVASPIPGYEKEIAQQAKVLGKEQAKDQKKGYWPWARGPKVTGCK